MMQRQDGWKKKWKMNFKMYSQRLTYTGFGWDYIVPENLVRC